MHASHVAVAGNDDRGKRRAVQPLLRDPEILLIVAQSDRMGVITGLLAPDDVDLETVFVDGGVLFGMPDAKGGINLAQDAEH